MVAFTASAAVDMNSLLGQVTFGNALPFSNELPGSFTGTFGFVSFVFSSSLGDFLYLAIPFSGTITGIEAELSSVPQYNVTGLSISVSNVLLHPEILAPAAIFAGDDVISGSHFADVLVGFAGNDTINGGRGNDKLTGGPGTDRLTGGPGADRFIFTATSDSAVGANRDTITDFKHSQHDRIDLSAIDADQRASHPGNQAFVFIGTDTFAHYHALHHSVVGMVRFNPATHVLQGNVNASLAPDFEIALLHVASLVPGDFVL